MSADLLAQITQDLPDWPEELRSKFLLPEALKKGWPPRANDSWRLVIGADQDLPTLQRMWWRLTELTLRPEMLRAATRSLLVDMFRGYYTGEPSTFHLFPSGKVRFEGIAKTLAETNAFPWAPALTICEDGFQIWDGNHRILAYFYLSGQFKSREGDGLPHFRELVLPFWVGGLWPD